MKKIDVPMKCCGRAPDGRGCGKAEPGECELLAEMYADEKPAPLLHPADDLRWLWGGADQQPEPEE